MSYIASGNLQRIIKMSNDKESLFTKNEIAAIYKIVREHQENIPKTEEEIHEDYYDNYEELVGKKVLQNILKKLSRGLPTKEKEEIDKYFLRQKYHSFSNGVDEIVYRIIEKAFNQLNTIEIKYFNMENAEFSKRKLDVYYKSRKYTIGYCHLRKSIRKFRTHRIASAKLTSESYKIPEDFDNKAY